MPSADRADFANDRCFIFVEEIVAMRNGERSVGVKNKKVTTVLQFAGLRILNPENGILAKLRLEGNYARE